MKELTIETSRLIIRPVIKEDAEHVFANFTHETAKYMVIISPKELSDAQAVVDRYIKQREDGTDLVCVVIEKSTNTFIGMVGLDLLKTDTPECWIWLKKEAFGNYYGREATLELIRYAKTLGYKKVSYPVDKRNIESNKIPLFFGNDCNYMGSREIYLKDGRTLFIEDYVIDLSQAISKLSIEK